MRKNIGRQDAYWRVGTGVLALLWASRRQRNRLAKATVGLYGLVALAQGVTRYDPIMEALGLSTNEEDNTNGVSATAQGDGASEAGGAAAAGRTILKLGNLVIQHLPRRAPKSLWGVAQGATMAPESNSWSWDELGDTE